MQNVLKGVMTVVVLFIAAIMAYTLVATAPVAEQVEPEEVATSIRIQTIESQQVQLKVRSQGTVKPRTESEMIPEVSGKVHWISPSLVAGGFFEAGELLLKIDDKDYRSALDRASAAYARAAAEDEHARFELARVEELASKQLASQSNLESALRTRRIATAALNEAAVTLAQSERDLMRTEIRAPYTGLVRIKKVDQGQFISRGTSVAQIYASDSVEVRIPLAVSQLAYLDLPLGHRGELPAAMQANVILDTDYGGRHYEWQGKLVRTEAEIDARTRMVTAVVRVENIADPNTPPLPVGLFVNATIEGRLVDDIVVLPRAALRNQNQVLIVDEDNRLRFREVELLRFDRDQVMISKGLAPGERINLSPIQTVIDGMRVKPVVDNAKG
ncbi:MAG: efflux RND transporter periplasmic adaptor subunit [Pseudomonadales bacterium]